MRGNKYFCSTLNFMVNKCKHLYTMRYNIILYTGEMDWLVPHHWEDMEQPKHLYTLKYNIILKTKSTGCDTFNQVLR